MTETVPSRANITPLQRGWLIVYRLALPVVAILLLIAIATFSGERFASMVALVLATVSLVLGLIFSSRLARSTADDVVFLKGTSTVRVIAVAWTLIGLAILTGGVVAAFANVEVEAVDWSGGFAGTAGSLSILAILGPGYAEYREALKIAQSESEHAS